MGRGFLDKNRESWPKWKQVLISPVGWVLLLFIVAIILTVIQYYTGWLDSIPLYRNGR